MNEKSKASFRHVNEKKDAGKNMEKEIIAISEVVIGKQIVSQCPEKKTSDLQSKICEKQL